MQNTVSSCVTGRPGWKFKHERNATHTLYWEWLEHVCPETLWSLYPLRYSKFSFSWPWASPCTEQEGGTTQPQEASTNLSSSALLFGPYQKMLQVSISSVPPPEHLTVLRQPWDDTEQMPESKLSLSQMEALTPIPQNNSPAFWYYDTMILALLAALWSSFNKNCGSCSQSGCSLTRYSATFLQLFNKYSRHGQDNFFYPERGVSVSYNN